MITSLKKAAALPAEAPRTEAFFRMTRALLIVPKV